MNPKERVLNILERKPVDRMPVDIWHTPEWSETLHRFVYWWQSIIDLAMIETVKNW